MTLNKLGRHDEEILAYKRAIGLKPDHANALEKLGQAYFRQKRWAEAANAFEGLRTYRPDAKTYNALGECYLELDRPEDALLAFNNALGYDPNLDQARFNLGRAYLRSGNKEMAQVQYEILRNSRSDWADRLLVLLNQ
ncbi:tetratricopeptide repeat protein [Leptolyngbya sp. 7M]|nr:tetratricopeptide repeat protein [Leptolyngbya sp. 7M]